MTIRRMYVNNYNKYGCRLALIPDYHWELKGLWIMDLGAVPRFIKRKC